MLFFDKFTKNSGQAEKIIFGLGLPKNHHVVLQQWLSTFFILVHTRGGTAGFCVFLSDPGPESTILEKRDPDPQSLFNFGSNRSLCGLFLSKNMGKLWLDR